MQEQPVYEVRCERCQTSFAPETRRCVHCGGTLGRGGRFAALPAQDGAAIDPETGEEVGGRMRNPLWILTAVLAVLASVARSCFEG